MLPLSAGYGTNMASALNLLRSQVFRAKSKNRNNADDIVIMITDAKVTLKASETIESARLLREDGARVFAIGIGGEDVSYPPPPLVVRVLVIPPSPPRPPGSEGVSHNPTLPHPPL